MTNHQPNHAVLNALPIGYRFNEFEIQEMIGGGDFGIVYRAWDHQLERTIAIKEFMPSLMTVRNEDMALVLRNERFSQAFSAGLNSFIQEARILACFNHPNLLHVLRFWTQNNTAYMATLFYSGTILSRLREQQPYLINEAWIRHILPMLLGAIKTLHDTGYLHRDISPDNIQIQDNGLPVLFDFGSARRTISHLSDGTETMLRPGYAPVEQYSDDNESEQGAWTDIYAVGAVLHTLIVGSPPPVSVVRGIQDNYQLLVERKPPGYSLSLLQAVDNALALHMEDRPQSIEAFAKLINTPIYGIDDVLSIKKAETTPPLVQDQDPALATHGWQRYKVPGMVTAVILTGMVASGMRFNHSMSGPRLPAIPKVSLSTADPPAAPAIALPSEPIAQVYIRMEKGETLRLNGEPHDLQPESNGFISLQLPPGDYEITLQGNDHIRQQTLNITRAGTWLINPTD
ncbi:serine/threonine-protein kinase [Enterobacteriaceae bacterium ESL0689]|nr:serine/threonine-protein kinase [Enterobacteriaceae bacterium ESL0689]